MKRITFGRTVGGRSASFDAWLREQTPERRAEIEAAERQYVDTREVESAERDHAESLMGLEEVPAGPSRARPAKGNRPGFDF